jgi:quercetin dioxygenase-like cupin family protein
MKRIITAIAGVLALGSLAFAAEQKEKSMEKTTAAKTVEHTVLTPADLKWGEPPPGLPAGAKLAVLEGDPTKKGEFTIRLQAPDGYKVAPHTHPTAEKVTVISGTLFLGTGAKFDEAAAKELSQGSFAIMPAGMQHFAWTKGDTIIQIHGPGPFEIKYVNPADDPRHAKQ